MHPGQIEHGADPADRVTVRIGIIEAERIQQLLMLVLQSPHHRLSTPVYTSGRFSAHFLTFSVSCLATVRQCQTLTTLLHPSTAHLGRAADRDKIRGVDHRQNRRRCAMLARRVFMELRGGRFGLCPEA